MIDPHASKMTRSAAGNNDAASPDSMADEESTPKMPPLSEIMIYTLQKMMTLPVLLWITRAQNKKCHLRAKCSC